MAATQILGGRWRAGADAAEDAVARAAVLDAQDERPDLPEKLQVCARSAPVPLPRYEPSRGLPLVASGLLAVVLESAKALEGLFVALCFALPVLAVGGFCSSAFERRVGGGRGLPDVPQHLSDACGPLQGHPSSLPLQHSTLSLMPRTPLACGLEVRVYLPHQYQNTLEYPRVPFDCEHPEPYTEPNPSPC